MSVNRALIFGEVLFDCFEDGSTVLGGAPFNVAWHLHGFGAQPLFVSRVGDDSLGRQIIDSMHQWGMDCDGMQIDPLHSTGRVSVALQEGQPQFDIESPAAYDFIDGDEVVEKLVKLDLHSLALIYHGSLITRHQHSKKSLAYLRSRLSAPVFIDINLRAPWHSRQQAALLIEGASWLKLNEDELALLSAASCDSIDAIHAAARQFYKDFSLQGLIVTLGHKGAFILSGEQLIQSPPAPTEDLIDTVGAGDALSSVMLLGMLKGWEMADTLPRAVAFASAICEQQGATAFSRELYQQFLQQWSC